MSQSTGLSLFIEGDAINIEAGSLSYGIYLPKYDPTPMIKAGQRSTIASEKLDDNMQKIEFRIDQAELDKLRSYAQAKGAAGMNVSLTNGVIRFDYRNMFIASDSEVMVEDNGKPTCAITLTGTQVA